MTNIKTVSVALLGLILIVLGVGFWVLGDATNLLVTLPLASTGVHCAPLIWLLGIIVLLSAAFANTMQAQNYFVWLLVLVVGYLAVFAVLVAVTSAIIP
jgi:O-antigen/teichoic acid export membrane protein